MEEKKSSVDGQEAANVVMVMSLFDQSRAVLLQGSFLLCLIGRGQNPNEKEKEKEKLVLASRKTAVSNLN